MNDEGKSSSNYFTFLKPGINPKQFFIINTESQLGAMLTDKIFQHFFCDKDNLIFEVGQEGTLKFDTYLGETNTDNQTITFKNK